MNSLGTIFCVYVCSFSHTNITSMKNLITTFAVDKFLQRYIENGVL